MSKKQENSTTEAREARSAAFKTKQRGNKQLDALKSNDISYYNKNKINYDKATAVPWVSTLGDIVPLANTTVGGYSMGDMVFPGLCVYDVTVGPGYAVDNSDPLNVALTKIMSELYGRTSASTIPFAQADLGYLLTSTSSISGTIAYAKKLVDASHVWVDRNVYYPRAIFHGCGVDFTDFISHQATYVVRLNEIIRKFNSLYCLKFVDVYDRQYTLFRNIYADEDSPMGQMYLFKPNNYYKYDDTQMKCIAYDFVLPNGTFSDILDIIDDCIAQWLSSQDLYYMNGYLNRAFQTAERLVIDEISGTELINPVVDEVMELQINNATILPTNATVGNLDITQDPVTGAIQWMPKASIAGSDFTCWNDRVMLKCYKADPTSDDNMEMTRFTALVSAITTSGSTGDIYLCGPEFISGIHVITYNRFTNTITSDLVDRNIYWITFNAAGSISFGSAAAPGLYALCKLSSFRVMPLIILVTHNNLYTNWPTGGSVPTAGEPINVHGDIYNYTTMSLAQYRDMQRTALFSLYNVVTV